MCYCDCEPPEIYSEWTPLARKQHVCLFCRRDIEGYAQPINLQSDFNTKRKEPVAA